MKGFTLIETIIYIALFSLIMSGTMLTTYQLISEAGHISSQNIVVQEGDFVVRKIHWATLLYGDQMQLKLKDGKIEIREDASYSYLPLTTDKVMASELGTSTFTLNGEIFSL